MHSRCARAALPALMLLALGSLADEADEAYSLLDPDTLCSNFLVPDVPSPADCFGRAMASVGLSGTVTLEVPGLPFKGCVYNTAANMVFFGTGKGGVATGTFRYLCVGIATTVTETATTATTVETTASTQTLVPYTMLDPDTSCAMFLLPEVVDQEECFGVAVATVFPGGKRTYAIPGMPFYGCVYNAQADVVLFNAHGDGSGAETSPNLRQVCRGVPTTTTQTTTSTRTETGTDTTTETETGTTTATATQTETGTWTTATRTTGTSTPAAGGDYLMLGAGMLCSALSLPGVAAQDECFELAAPSVDLVGSPTLALSGMPFDGCVYNADAGLVLFGSGGVGVAPSPSIRPICRTAAATETATPRPAEAATTSVTTALPRYSLLALGTSCAGAGSSVPSKAECFGDAAQTVDLGAKHTLVLTGSSFGGCVYSPALGYVMWNSEGPRDAAPPYVQPICRTGVDGAPSTTDTTTYVLV